LPAAPPGFTIVKRPVTIEGKGLFPPPISISHGASSPKFTKRNFTSEETAYAEVIFQDVQEPLLYSVPAKNPECSGVYLG